MVAQADQSIRASSSYDAVYTQIVIQQALHGSCLSSRKGRTM